MKPPSVAIVGRPNVGKSSLLNMLAGRRVSIVDPTAGVTRDRVCVVVDLPEHHGHRQMELVDTGGYGVHDTQNLTAEIERQITLALAEADLILLVTDAQTGIVPLDHAVGRLLRTMGVQTPVIPVANKVDGASHEHTAHEAARLGFGPPVMVSATSGRNRSELIDTMGRHLSGVTAGRRPCDQTPEPVALFAVAGKRNAGKSTLVNALAGQPRVIVSELEGTTRDSIDVRFEIDGQVFTAIDTAGVRKTKSLAGDIEYYSHHRTLRSIRRADVVLLLIDAAVPISQVDRQLVAEILKHHRPCLVVLNKWDLAQDHYTQEQYVTYLDDALKGLKFAPVAFVCAKQSDGLGDIVATAMKLYHQAGERISTGLLNRVVEQVLSEHTPSAKNGRRPKIYYATQLDIHPPTIGLFVNDPAMFDPAYQRFLINRFRDLLPFPEVPIKLAIKGKKSISAEARLALQQSR